MTHTRRGSSRALLALALAATAGLAGCDGVFDVNNPNNVLQEDVEKPESSTALVNGVSALLADADAGLQRSLALVSDETVWVGSLNDRGDLDYGNIANARNNDVDDVFNDFAEARWLADETVRLLEIFEEEGTLDEVDDLARAYLYAGMTYTRIAEHFDDFVISDRREAGAPIGAEGMPQLFDKAIGYLDAALTIARAEGDTELERTILAMRARTKYAAALRSKLSGTGDPLVNAAGAVADARAFLDSGAAADWKFSWVYDGVTGSNAFASDVNSRREQRVSDAYIVPAEDNRRIESIHLQDPLTGEVDPVLSATISEFESAVQYAPFTVVSTREMRLILAEAALAQGDEAGFTTHINAVRSLNGLTPYSGQIPAIEMLQHMRRVNLFFQAKRLHDQYRFGIRSPEWLATSDAYTAPGTRFPIGYTELVSNCHLTGAC